MSSWCGVVLSCFHSFSTSSLKRKLKVCLVAAGKYIFGDNTTYVNTTPYIWQHHSGWHHLQLGINVECVFGMLIQQWLTSLIAKIDVLLSTILLFFVPCILQRVIFQ